MEYIKKELTSVVGGLSDKNYEQSLDFYRLWFDIGHAYANIQPTQTLDDIWTYRGSSAVNPGGGQLFHPTAHLILRFAGDLESDPVIGPLSGGLQSRLCARLLQSRLCARLLQSFFEQGMIGVYQRRGNTRIGGFPSSWHPSEIQGTERCIASDSNLIALWANLGYVEETAIRNRILQSLISFPQLYDHQADAMIILFKIAGATFEAYADPSVVDRCFELLKNHYSPDSVKGRLVQEVLELRERGWEGLPPPPIFTSTKAKPAGAGKEDSSATPIATSLGLPSTDLEPQVTLPSPTEPAPAPEVETAPAPGAETSSAPETEMAPASETETAPDSPVTQSPSISIATLSDFTIADTPDDESPVNPAAVTPHETFYLEDGNVEVLCENTLFRVHTSTLSFHSPALRQMFPQTSLASTESPNGCPRILSSDTAADFATLLKMIYLPRFPERNKPLDFTTFSSLLRISTKYEMPAVRSHLLDIIRDAYPETFEGVTPTKSLGETAFSGPTPHPNEVLNLFIQQKLTSALPMAYYMAARRGLSSLMDRRLPKSATLPSEVLEPAMKGFIALRELELNETHRLVLGPRTSGQCSSGSCPSRKTTGQGTSDAHRWKIIDRITGSSRTGMKVLEVFSLNGVNGGDIGGFCESCVKGWEAGHAEVRRRAWDTLPSAFGLKT